jgi:hypothetical protein
MANGSAPTPDGRLPASKPDVTLLEMLPLSRPVAAGVIAAICSIGRPRAAGAQAPVHPSVPTPYTPSTPPPLETGGLRPPAPLATPPGESETLQKLERAEREDAGRGLEFLWVDVEGGYAYTDLQALASSSLLDGTVLSDASGGLTLGAGAGVRFIFLTFGARLRLTRLDDFDLWTVGGEVGLHFPHGALEPSFTFGVAYAAASPSVDGLDADGLAMSGISARFGANLDYYVNPLLSFGARGTFETLALWRSGAEQPAGSPIVQFYAEDGSGVGVGGALTATVGLHF